MEKGLVDLAELRSNMSSANYEGKSSYGFKMGNKFIKVYIRKSDKGFFTPPDVDNIVDFSKFEAKTIVFPDEYIYEDGKKAGEISKFVNGKRLDENVDFIIIDRMIKSYEDVIADLYLYDFIDMIDLCYVNIIYSNRSGFHIIDTTDWKFRDNSLKLNIRRLNSCLIDAIVEDLLIPITYSKYYSKIDEIFYNNMAKYGNGGKRLQKEMNLLMNNEYRFLDFLYAYQEVYRIHYGEDANTLKDVKEFTKVLKKG